jgi:hypothetical protein
MRSRVTSLLIKRAARGAVIASEVDNLTKMKMTTNKIKQPMRKVTTKKTKQPTRKITFEKGKS